MPATKTATLNLRIDPGRSIANLVEVLIREHCAKARIPHKRQAGRTEGSGRDEWESNPRAGRRWCSQRCANCCGARVNSCGNHDIWPKPTRANPKPGAPCRRQRSGFGRLASQKPSWTCVIGLRSSEASRF